VVQSVGCATQFKIARAWHFIVQYPQVIICEKRPKDVEMIWNYFANGHGKGEIDGASVLLKHEIHKEQFRPQAQNLANIHDIVTFCQQGIGIMAFLYLRH
jgi:hypothetical protein